MKKIISFIAVLFIGSRVFANNSISENSNANVSMVSFLGTSNPRGIRNNNPGNIKIGNSAWQHKIPISENTDGTFEQFETYVWGVRAMTKVLKNYINEGTNTINKIINKYAPSSDNNNVGAYINAVVEASGFSENEILTANKSTLKFLVISMAFHENGKPAVDEDFFNAAYNLL